MKSNAGKYIIWLLLACGGFSFLLISALHKFRPFFFKSTVYYCQEILRTMSVQLIPNYWSQALVFISLLFIGYIVVRMTVFLAQFVIQIISLRKRSIPVPPKLKPILSQHHLTAYTQVYRTSKPLAFCFGTTNAKIYISTGLISLLTGKELEAVLLHEKYHLDHHDTFFSILTTVLEHCFPFFPLVGDIAHRYYIAREVLADASVLSQCKRGKQRILSVLRKLLEVEPNHMSTLFPAVGSADTLETRIAVLMDTTPPSRRFSLNSILLSGISALVLLVLNLSPVQAIEMSDKGSGSVMMCFSAGECTTWCKETSAHLPVPEENTSKPQFSAELFSKN